MPDALATFVAGTPPESHGDHAGDIRQRDGKPRREIRNSHPLHDLRQPQRNTKEPYPFAEINHSEGIDAWIAQRWPKVAMFGCIIAYKPRGDDLLFVFAQPWRVLGTVGKKFQNGESKKNGGRAFDQE